MITAKFGGTAVTAQNLHCISQLIGNCGCVVVSAIGKEHPNDKKSTDLLKAHFFGDSSAWGEIESKYKRLVEVNSINIDVEKLLHVAKQKSKISLPHCLSLGEELAGKIVATHLACPYLEAESLFVFNGTRFVLKSTLANLKSAFQGLERGVIGGFYGGSATGRQVFSRGGGDVTGSVCAVATQSNLYENWTDVCGVCKANPRLVFGAESVSCLSYNEMFNLAKGGAEVLHPDAVAIVQKFGIPIKIGNYLNSSGNSTLISNCPSREKFLSVTERRENGFVTTVLHGMNFEEVLFRLHRLAQKCSLAMSFDVGCGNAQCACKIFADKVVLFTQKSILCEVYDAFNQANC